MKGKRITFLRSYIDFCFMLIIILISLLSIAYFEPPGTGAGDIKQELKTTLEKVHPEKIIELKKETEDFRDEISKEKIKKLKKVVVDKEEKLSTLQKRIKDLEKEIERLKYEEVHEFVGRHEFTDLTAK